MSAEKKIKQNTSKKIKQTKIKSKDIIIIEEKSPKNITLKTPSSSSNMKKRCKNDQN